MIKVLVSACLVGERVRYDGAESKCEKALAVARKMQIRIAILKDRSPSCGKTCIYDGSFSKVRRPGNGVTTALLEKNGISVFSENEIEKAAAYLVKQTS